jgi:VCBS repeat-containing protein
VGTATAIRNGVSIILNNGDDVKKGDVVQSGSDSRVGITFIDGTVFGLSSNARMVLNEMVYDPNGSNNSSLLSLVAGTISFVAGETAKHGDMKVDTPVATMGIRGTAVLVEIDFQILAQGGAPDAKFQVLVEPDGTTGSYVLLDKSTLAPLATVNQAGTQTVINGQGSVNFFATAPLSADAQKIIIDVFTLKFTGDPNPKTTTAQNDTITPQSGQLIKLASGDIVIPTLFFLHTSDKSSWLDLNEPLATFLHHLPPDVVAFGSASIERLGITHSSKIDAVSGTIRFADVNAGDLPTVSATFASFTYQNAQNNDVTATLTAQQLAAIAAVEVPLVVVPDPGNTNIGSATWTYSVADGAFDFLAAGEILTLIYGATVDDGHGGVVTGPLTVSITGTNDTPVILSETNAPTQAVIVLGPATPSILDQGVNTNSIGLETETFDSLSSGSSSNNGAGTGNFYSATLHATFTASGNAGIVSGSFPYVTGAPFVGPGNADTTNYLSIGAGGTETITFATEENTFGLYWGSVDAYNTINFYDGATLVASYTGADVSPLSADGNLGSFSSNGYVQFSGLAPFNKVVLGTGDTNAFE